MISYWYTQSPLLSVSCTRAKRANDDDEDVNDSDNDNSLYTVINPCLQNALVYSSKQKKLKKFIFGLS